MRRGEPLQAERGEADPLRLRQRGVAQREFRGEPQQDVQLVFEALQLVHEGGGLILQRFMDPDLLERGLGPKQLMVLGIGMGERQALG